MATRSASAQEQYWKKRLASPAFRRTLAAGIAAELHELGRLRVGQLIDPKWVRALIQHWDTRVVDRAVVAEAVIAANRRGARRLASRRDSLVDLLDPSLVAELEGAIDAGLELTARGREFLTALMEREFVRGLFTDLIFTALVAFQRKVNPLFGALAARALEDQIKGFIGLFMPMLQAQAIAFAVNRSNQRAVIDLVRAITRQLLAMPIGRFAAMAAPEGGGSLDALLRLAAANSRLADLSRRAVLAAWDDVFASVKNRRIGDLLRIEDNAEWLADRVVAMLLPLVNRPGIVAVIARDIADATVPGRPSAPQKRRRKTAAPRERRR